METHFFTCRHWPTEEEAPLTRSVLGPDALPPMPHPIPPDAPSPTGRGFLATYRDIEPNPDPATTDSGGGGGRQVLPLDAALLAPGIRGHFTQRPDTPGQTLWWCSRCGMSWRAARAASTCPDGCAPGAPTPQRGHQSWLRHRKLVIGKRSPEYQALRSAGVAGAGTDPAHRPTMPGPGMGPTV